MLLSLNAVLQLLQSNGLSSWYQTIDLHLCLVMMGLIIVIMCQQQGYELCLFHAHDAEGRPIYHTNVVMALGTSVAVLCTSCIRDPEEKQNLLSKVK